MTEKDIRSGLRTGELSRERALLLVEAELALAESASLWNLRGDLIPLAESPRALEDARSSYEHAILLAPDDPEAYESLGHFYDAVEPHWELARQFYMQALGRGAGEACRLALMQLLEEHEK